MGSEYHAGYRNQHRGLKREFKIVDAGHGASRSGSTAGLRAGRRLRAAGLPARQGAAAAAEAALRQERARRGAGAGGQRQLAQADLSERGLRAAGQPQIEILSHADEGDLEYKLAIELIPDIKPIDFKTAEARTADRRRCRTTRSSEAIERAAKRFASPAARDRRGRRRPAMSWSSISSARSTARSFPAASATDHHLRARLRLLHPGLRGPADRRAAGDITTVTVTFPADYPNAEAGGQGSHLRRRRSRRSANWRRLDVDDELAKAMGAKRPGGAARAT